VSINLEIKAANCHQSWPIPTSAVHDIGILKQSGYVDDVKIIFGEHIDSHAPYRLVERQALLNAVTRLSTVASKLPANFHVRAQLPFQTGKGGFARGVSGLLIDGVRFSIHCYGDYWRMTPIGVIPRGHWLPTSMRGYDRYDDAAIPTENMGIVVVEAKRNKVSDLTPLLTSIRTVLFESRDNLVTVSVG